MKKIVLITGGFGFVGRHTALYLNKQGYYVIGIGHGHWNKSEYIRWGIKEWIPGTITLKLLTGITKKINYVIHCAGGSTVKESQEFPQKEYKKTMGSLLAVLEYIRLYQKHTRFLYISSVAIYGVQKQFPISTNVELHPISSYGWHKLIAENYCQYYRETYNLDIGILRLFTLYGPGLSKQLLWDICKKLNSSLSTVRLLGSGKEVRDLLYIDDATNLIWKLMLSKKQFTILNGGSGKGFSILEIANLCKDVFESEKQVVFSGESNEGNPAYYIADIQNSKKFSWKPRVSLEEGITNYIDWFKRNNL